MNRSLALTACTLALALPASAQVIHTWTGTNPSDRLGWSLAAVPDTDQDGRPDVVIGVPFDPVSSLQVGSARLFSGAGGAFTNEYVGDAALDHAGWSVAGLGDLNGDGRGEVAVGLPDSDDKHPDAGLVRVHSGLDGAVLFAWPGASAGEAFGYRVANAGDVDGDGRDDVLIGAWAANAKTGRAEVRSGLTGALVREHAGFAPGDRYGFALAGLGDLDGDGRGDYGIGAPQVGTGPGYAHVVSGASGLQIRVHVGLSSGDELGSALAGRGDVHGDGYAEYALGAPLALGPGGSARPGAVIAFDGLSGAAVWTVFGDAAGDRLGSALDGGLDVDGDLHPDVFVGAPFASGGRGAARVLSGLDGATLRQWSGTAGGDRFGQSVALAGDLDGDGVPDVLVGAPREDAGGTDAGVARAFSGAQGCGPTSYCTAKQNSAGCLPRIAWSGSPTLSGADDFVVTAGQVLGKSVGVLIWTEQGQAATPALGGTLCLAKPFLRSAPIQAGGVLENDCTGVLSFAFTQVFMAQQGWGPGDHVDTQFWSRDFAHPDGSGSSLSDALSIDLCP